MMRKPRAISFITIWSLALALLLLVTGCVAIPATQPAPVTTTQVVQSSVTPLPSLCTSVEVQSYPSSAFRLKILVKNSTGKPAPGARLVIAFYNHDAPVVIQTDEHGYAIVELHDEELILPDAHGRTSGTLNFYITTAWKKPNSGAEYLLTCVSQEIDLLVPSEIAVTVDLPE
jgi:hypothetical protein